MIKKWKKKKKIGFHEISSEFHILLINTFQWHCTLQINVYSKNKRKEKEIVQWKGEKDGLEEIGKDKGKNV